MWTTILSLVFGTLPTIVGQIAQARNNAINAKTDQERIHAEEQIKTLEAQRDVLIADSKSPWDMIARFCLMAPFAIIVAWMLLWDKIACKWFTPVADQGWYCTTDPLSPWLTGLAGAIYGFYFLAKVWRR